jgi:hypothetical protein
MNFTTNAKTVRRRPKEFQDFSVDQNGIAIPGRPSVAIRPAKVPQSAGRKTAGESNKAGVAANYFLTADAVSLRALWT